MLIYIILGAITVITILCSGLVERETKQKKKEVHVGIIWNVVKIGTLKLISAVGIAILTAAALALLLSLIVKPEPANIMPGYFYDGTYAYYNGMEIDEATIDTILTGSRQRMDADREAACYDMAYGYFSSGNFDYAITALETCYESNPDWKYAYDLGIAYSYMRDYRSALNYLQEALELNPPYENRGVILNTVAMLENYYSIWITSLFG